MPVLSVIVPVYNKENYLKAAIASILAQDFSDLELILINDGSTDDSPTFCQAFKRIDSRVIVIDQSNQGVSAARNAGLKIASGEYVGFVDADDTIEPDMFSLLVNNATLNNADISGCGFLFNRTIKLPAEKKDATVIYNHKNGLKHSLNGEFERSANNKIFKRAMLREVRFEGKIYEDILFNCRAFIRAGKTVYSSAKKYNYLVRENSVSAESFNEKYFEMVAVSGKMVEMIRINDPACLSEAKAFDVMTNISLLNLLLLADLKKYKAAYAQVVKNLAGYKQFTMESPLVRKKHQYAYKLFALSPSFYRFCMYLYCRVAGSEVVKRS